MVRFASFLLVALSGAAAAPRVVDIGLITDRTGTARTQGYQFERVASASVAYFNNHSSGAVVLRLRVLDSASTSTGAYLAARRAPSNMTALVGPSSSDGTSRAMLAAAKRRTPLLGFSATSTALAQPSSTLLRTVPSDRMRVRALLTTIAHFRWERFAVVHVDDAYGRAFSAEVARQLREMRKAARRAGGKNKAIPAVALTGVLPPVRDARSEAGWQDMADQVSEVCAQIKEQGTRVVVMAAFGADAALVLGTAQAKGLAGVKGWVWLSPEWLEDGTWQAAASVQEAANRVLGADGSSLSAVRRALHARVPSEGQVRAAMDGSIGVYPYHGKVHLEALGVLSDAEGAAAASRYSSNATVDVTDPYIGHLFEAVWLLGKTLERLAPSVPTGDELLAALSGNGNSSSSSSSSSTPFGIDARDLADMDRSGSPVFAASARDGSLARALFDLRFDAARDRLPAPMQLYNYRTFSAGKHSGGQEFAEGTFLANSQMERIGLFGPLPPKASGKARWGDFQDPAALRKALALAVQDLDAWGARVYADASFSWPGQTPSTPSDRTPVSVHGAAVALTCALLMMLAIVAISALLLTLEVHWIPEAAVPILVGALVAGAVELGGAEGGLAELDAYATFDTTFFALVLLPIIMFESGYDMQPVFFLSQVGSIATFATVGSVVSALVIASGLRWGVDLGTVRLTDEECIAFASLIGAVDPVTTLSIFGELRVDARLNALVFGESVLNDVIAVALFRAATYFFDHDVTAAAVSENLVTHLALPAAGSMAVGVAISLCCVLALRAMKLSPINSGNVECLLVLVHGYLAFAVCELFHWSGIIAALLCGMLLNSLAVPNLTEEGRHACHAVFRFLTSLSETVIFVLCGFTIVSVGSSDLGDITGADLFTFVWWTLLLCLLGRAANIFPLAAVVNLCRAKGRRIPWQHQVVQWHAGARGAIAFAIALTFPSQNRKVVILCTSAIIVFTVLVMGGTTVAVLDRLHIKMGHDPTKAELEQEVQQSVLARLLVGCAKPLFWLLWGGDVCQAMEQEGFGTMMHEQEIRNRGATSNLTGAESLQMKTRVEIGQLGMVGGLRKRLGLGSTKGAGEVGAAKSKAESTSALGSSPGARAKIVV
jgi:sodium/hydrogen exchanger 8